MAKSIDSKVVQLAFENDRFEKGVSQSLKSLNQLNKNVDQMSVGSFDQVIKAIDNMSNRFTLMGQVGFAAVNKITGAVIDLGAKLIKNLIIPPSAISGFQEYELTINSIQTLMAGTGESLERVNEKLAELNKYSDETIYSFSDMTSNIGKFTNAGVKLDDAVDAMKGIANAAALSGASANDAARAMFNLGQAMGTGYVLRRDWMSVENANMATIEFKTQLVETAQAVGLLTKRMDGYFQTSKGAHSLMSLFTEGLQDQWLTTDVLIKTFNRYADSTTDIGRRSSQAAKRVSTFSKMMDTLKEGVQSGWAQSMQLIIGDFEEATQLWSTLAGVIGRVTDATAKNRNELLKMWKDTGGRDAFIEGLSNALIALHNVVAPIKEAWRSIFPPKSGSMVVDLLKGFSRLTNGLIINQETAIKVANVFRSVFGVLSVGINIVKSLFSVFSSIASRVLPVIIDGFNTLSDIVEYFYTLLSPYVVQGFSIAIEQLGLAMDYVANKANNLIEWVRKTFEAFKVAAAESGAMNALSDVIYNLFNSMKNIPNILKQGLASALTSIEGLGTRFSFLGTAVSFGINLVSEAADFFGSSLETIKNGLNSVIDYLNPFTKDLNEVKEALIPTQISGNGIFDGLLDGIRNLNPFKDTVSSANELASGMEAVDNNLNKIAKNSSGIGNNIITIVSNIKVALSDLFQRLSEMSGAELFFTGLQGAVVIGFAALSFTITKAIAGAFVSIANGISTVFKSVAGITKGVDDTVSALSKAINRFGKDNASTILKTISISLLAFAAALFVITRIPFNKLIQGSAAIGLFMTGIVVMMKMFDQFEGSNAMAAQIAGLSASLLVLGFAVKSLGTMDMGTLVKGLLAISLGLTAIFAPLKLLGRLAQNGSISGLGSVILSLTVSLKLLSGSIKSFGSIDFRSLVKGILGVGASLLALVAPLMLLTQVDTSKLSGMATILLGTAVSIRLIVSAVKSLSNVESLLKTFVTLTGVIVLLAAAVAGLAVLNSKYDLAPVAKSISMVASSLGILALAMLPLTLISWKTITKGLVLLAGAFAGLLGAGAIFSMFPNFAKGAELFAKTLNLLGKALMAISAGIGLFAVSLLLLGTAGTAGLLGLSSFLVVLSSVAPLIKSVVGVIAGLGLSLGLLGVGVLALGAGFALLDKRGVAGIAVLGAMFAALVVFADNVKKLGPAMLKLSLGVAVLAGAFFVLSKVIDQLEFSTTVKLAAVGAALLLFTKLLGDNIEAAGIAAASIAVLAAALYLLSGALGAATIAGAALVIGIAAIIISFALAVAAVDAFIQTLENIDGKKVGENFVNIGVGMVEGLIKGIVSIGQTAVDAVTGLITKCVNAVKSLLEIHSPSRVFYDFGINTGKGYANGLTASADQVRNSAIVMIQPGIDEVVKGADLYGYYGATSAINYGDGLAEPQIQEAVGAAAEELANKANQMLASKFDAAYESGREVGSQFAKGIEKEGIFQIGQALNNVAYSIGHGVGSLQLTIESWLIALGRGIDRILTYVAGIPGRIMAWLDQVWLDIVAFFDKIKGYFARIWEWLTTVHFDFAAIFMKILELVINFFGNLGQNLFLLGTWIMGAMEGVLKNLFTGYGKYLIALALGFINPLLGVAVALTAAITDIFDVLFDTAETDIGNKIEEGYNDAISSAEEKIAGITPRLQTAMDKALGKDAFVVPDSFTGVDFEKVYNDLTDTVETTTEKTGDSWNELASIIQDKTGIATDSVDKLKDAFKGIDVNKLITGVKSGDLSVIDDLTTSVKNLVSEGTTGLGAKGALDKLRETFGLDAMTDLGSQGGKGLVDGMNNALGSPDAKDKAKKSGKDQAKSFMDGFSEGVKDLDKAWTPMTVRGYNENKTLLNLRNYNKEQAAIYSEGIEDVKSLNEELENVRKKQSELFWSTDYQKGNRDEYYKQRDALDEQEELLKKRISNAENSKRLNEIYSERAAEQEKQLSYQRAIDEKYAEYQYKGKLEYDSVSGLYGSLPKEVLTEIKANFLQDENAIREMKRQQWQREMDEEKKLADEAAVKRGEIALDQSKKTSEQLAEAEKIPTQLSTTTQEIANQTGAMAQTAGTAINTTLDALITGTSSKTNQIKNAVAQPVNEFATQIAAQTPMVQESATQMMNTLATTISAQAPTFDQLGYTTMQAFVTGLTQRDPAILSTAMAQVFELVKSNLQPLIEQFTQLGVDIATGLANGIESGSSRAIQAAISLATRALQAAKAALNSNSPSKEFSTLGNDCALGLAQGLSNTQAVRDVQNGSKNLAETTMNSFSSNLKDADISGLSSALTEASNMVQNSMSSEPVIRPVVDLTDVEAASRQTGTMFNNQQLNVSGTSSAAEMAAMQYNMNNTLRVADMEVQREAAMNQKPPLTVNLTNNVRNDSDIQRISKELNTLIRNQGYAMGTIV